MSVDAPVFATLDISLAERDAGFRTDLEIFLDSVGIQVVESLRTPSGRLLIMPDRDLTPFIQDGRLRADECGNLLPVGVPA